MESQPIEVRPRVGLSSGSNVAVADDVGNRIASADPIHELGEHLVLSGREPPGVTPFQFDAA